MAIHGQKGSVLYSAKGDFTDVKKIAETTAWTLNFTQQTAEAAVQEQEYIVRAAGAKDWNVSIEGLAKATRGSGEDLVTYMVPQDDSTPAPGKIAVRLQNDKTGAVYQGTGFFTDLSVSSPEGGLVTVSATIAGDGVLTYASR